MGISPDGICFFCLLSGKSCDFPDGSHFNNFSSGKTDLFPDGIRFFCLSSGKTCNFPDGEVLSFGGDEYHSVGAAGAVDGCRTVFQDFHRTDITRTDMVDARSFDSVYDKERI